MKTYNHRLESYRNLILKTPKKPKIEVVKKSNNNDYQVPIHEIPIWIENGWFYDEFDNQMKKKGRESVNVQIKK